MESDGYQIPWKRGRDSSMVCRWDHCFTAACGQASDAERPGCCIQVTDKPMSHWCWKRLLSVSAPCRGLGSSAILLYRWPCDPRGAGLECTSMMKKTFFTFFLPKVSVMLSQLVCCGTGGVRGSVLKPVGPLGRGKETDLSYMAVKLAWLECHLLRHLGTGEFILDEQVSLICIFEAEDICKGDPHYHQFCDLNKCLAERKKLL